MLKKSVPPFVAEMLEMAALFEAEQPELDRLESILSELLAQFYIKTATYSLETWEKEFGLDTDPQLSLDQRRAGVLAKLNTRTPATVKMLENLVRQTMGEDLIRIVEHPEEYRFTVYVQEDWLSDRLGIARQAVHDARPAHLNYKFIERLIRKSAADTYGAAYGRFIYMSQVSADISRLYSPLYAAGLGRFIKIIGEEVKIP